MEKKFVERELKGARVAIVIAGILSWLLMVFSEYGDEAFRFSLISIFLGITIFMYAVITFLLKYPNNK
jgi:hypothetical protein